MLHLHHSNRAEILADALADLLREPAGPPLAPEVVLVQSQPVARWLSLALAERLGVCAGVRFAYPAAWLWELFRAALPDVPETSPFDAAVLAWRLFALLAKPPAGAHFAPVRRYLAGGDALQRWELARRIAGGFDRYLTYRPDWIERWQQGQDGGAEDEPWQAALWRQAAALSEGGFRADPRQRFFAALDAGQVPAGALPPRLALFGIPALPPMYLDAFARLARHTEVHLFLENPCREHWGLVEKPAAVARRAVADPAAAQYLEVGNPLLASMGRLARDFLDLLNECEAGEDQRFADPGTGSVLAALQSDILGLRSRGQGECPPLPLDPADRSLAVHACHGPMRELQVLHDALLALFEEERDLGPGDVVVLVPDIEAYAPLIEAVFGAAPPARRIAYAIADRAARAASPLADALFALLEWRSARFEASRVLALLEMAPLRRRLGLAEDDLERVAAWVAEAGIRWGLDAGHRQRLGLPAEAAHSWRWGLDRLLLGYALPGGGESLFEGILPVDRVRGAEAQALGALADFVEALAGLARELERPRPVAQWRRLADSLLERFADAGPEGEAERQRLVAALEAVERSAAQGGCDAPVPVAVFESALREALEAAAGAGGYLSGGVTFCALAPMRALPFQVVCVLGLDEGAFPRPDRPAGFDLLGRHWRRGDRPRRAEDRYAFLQALLSARRRLILSWCGFDPRDNSPRPPSPLLSELLDALRRGFSAEGGDAAAALTVEHPLQPFSRRYFQGGPLFSYAAEMCPPAARGEAASPPLLRGRLAEPGPEWLAPDLAQLVRFFRNPARFLIRERLGIALEAGEVLPEDSEPFAIERFAGEDLRAALVRQRLAGEPPERALALARAAGLAPHGVPGALALAQAADEAAALAERLAPLAAGAQAPAEFRFEAAGVALAGRLDGLTPAGRFAWRAGPMQGRDWVELWLNHLALLTARPAGVAPVSRFVSSDGSLALGPVADAEARLAALLALYREGLVSVLPFFPKTSRAYAQAVAKGRPDPLGDARRVWEGNERVAGEGAEPYRALAFGDADPLAGEFARVALAFFEPLLESVA